MDPTASDTPHIEASTRRVRVLFGGEWIADATRPLLVWERPHYPTYYLPRADVRADALVATDRTVDAPGGGHATVHHVAVGDRRADEAARVVDAPALQQLADTVRISWGAMDAWFEEDEQVYVHPRDPYKRVDVLASSRHVEVAVDGVTVADTHNPLLLFETGLPTRYYIPKTDARMDLLTPTDHTTRCPYKGTAEYYTVTTDAGTHDNLAWWYRHPTRESAPIAGYVSFYNEKVDVTVDDEAQDRPTTPFS